ncbi:ABC transporter ATP-binding protein [Subtercola endophyticus]|uniref:ABC transporter ATP-binding protein n=1 Tax=Subtercola endophyticus TaxID=2895559 RepID=UPI001E2DF480|nr:ABC transporter ATP-binding protein [Subtercola endophyticus]UFS57804.1 ABC transporter ATP-binding protein/permease [Subtercola endophyticus]
MTTAPSSARSARGSGSTRSGRSGGASGTGGASGGGRSRGRGRDTGGPRAKFSDLLPYLTEHKKVLALVIVLSLIGAAASLAQPLLVSQVITLVGQGSSLNGLVWLLVILVVVSGLISGFQHYLLQRTGEGVVLSSRRQLVRRMLHLPIREFDTRRTGDLVSRVGSDTTLLRAVLTQGFVDSIGGAFVFVGALVAMAIIDPVLLGLTVLVVGLSVVVVVLLSGRIRTASRQAQEKVGDLAASVERALSAVRTVRAANATDREIAEVEKDAEGAYRMGLQVARISALVVPVSGIALQVALLTVIGVGGYRVASGAITIASLISFILFLFMMIMPLGQAFGAFTSVNAALGALGRIQEIIKLPSEGENDPVAPAGSLGGFAVGDASIAVQFVGVQFAYATTGASAVPATNVAAGARVAAGADVAAQREAAEADPLALLEATLDGEALDELAGGLSREGAFEGSAASYLARPQPARDDTADTADAFGAEQPGILSPTVLRGVSFSVPRGKRVALVGPSGAGKSTILALIERFYDPTAGAILVGGVDIRQLDRRALRSQIGYVEQDAPVLAGSIRSNLLLASPEATDAECVEVLRAVNLLEVLERSPQGLDAQVGEEGVMLSGGERQRLAIARALLVAPPILLLDESTSSLDGLNEQMLREAIDAVAENRTLIVIAHRLSTVVDSDQIVVLDHGSVVGVGTHSELVETTPLYRELAKRQLLV